jgi:EKC/KEOPS complex subunit CGI121/TPRKB
MEIITLPHLPDHPLRVCLFKDVKNTAFLRQQLLDGNLEFEYAFLNASTLISRNHVLAACFRAINDQLNNRLKSRNVHSEIVFSLSLNNNVSGKYQVRANFLLIITILNLSSLTSYKIAESFRRFGIQDSTTNVLAIKVGGEAENVQSHLMQHVEGTPVEFSDGVIAGMCDAVKVKKIYRVDLQDLTRKGDAETAGREAEAFVLGAMALKGS